MQTRTEPRAILLLTALAASAAWAVRDPFLPIDYAPPVPVTEMPAEPEAPLAEPAPPPPPAQPVVNPVTAAEWAAARKAVKINGVTKSVVPGTGVATVEAMINRQTYATGDTVTLVREDVRFQWRVETITDTDVTLSPLKAERVAPKPANFRNTQ